MKLRASQHEMADFVIANPRCAIFSPMGAGKTASVTTAIEKLFRTKEIRRVLVVTTLRVAENTWPDEITEWKHTSYLEFAVLTGDESTRLAAARSKEQIHIINQENFVWLVMKAGRTWPYDMVVFDDAEGFRNANRKNKPKTAICVHRKECPIFEHEKSRVCRLSNNCGSLFKEKYSDFCGRPCESFTPVRSNLQACITLCNDFKAQPSRYSRFGALCALGPQIKRLVHLTGTPTNKGLVDFWPLIFTLDGGERLEKTYTQYKNKYFNRGHNGFGWDLKPGAEDAIYDKVKDLCIAVEAEVTLPAVHHIDKVIELPKEAAEMYDEFERELILNIEDDTIEAVNNGVLAGKLLQICGGAVYTGVEKEWTVLHTEKLWALSEIITAHPNEPILVGYNFKHELERLKAQFPHGVDIRDRKDAVHAWNAGDIPLMFAHPGSAGHGLNLQRGPGRVLVWFGLNWRLDYNKQFNKRLHRPGQQREVFIYYLIAKGRADVHLMEGVAKYDWTQKQLLEAVKRTAGRRKRSPTPKN